MEAVRRFGRLSSILQPKACKNGFLDHTSGKNSLAASMPLIEQELEGIRDAGTWKSERIITSRQGPTIRVRGQQKTILNFCANNYLGLSSHPAVVEAGKKAFEIRGAGMSSVRFICGTQDLHKHLEEKIAKFHGREDAILYASCFDANAGLFEVMLGEDDAIFSDEMNHASIIDGIRLCKAKRHRYKHTDMTDLANQLEASENARMKMIATDGVFSMDGNVSPLREICSLAEKHKALVFVDECHATGFFGPTGRGTEEHLGISGKVHLINSTLGKALGGAAGGYTTGPAKMVELLRQRSRPYLFSNALPPSVVACASQALDIIMDNPDLPQTVLANTKHFRGRMNEAGFTVSGDPEHPICPVMLGDAKLANMFADEMLERGIYVIGFSYPVVPKGKARIRVQLSACHSIEEVDQAVDAFIEIGRKMKVIQ
ncbi:hypothetical protein ScPMuIL_015250 [Solemya velum]